MLNICVLGDSNSHGGTITEATGTLMIDGKPNARLGDKVSCPLHGTTTICEGESSMLDDGVPVALHGHKCSCGCTLIASANVNVA